MIEIMEISCRIEDYDSWENFDEKYRAATARSYEEYISHGHS